MIGELHNHPNLISLTEIYICHSVLRVNQFCCLKKMKILQKKAIVETKNLHKNDSAT